MPQFIRFNLFPLSVVVTKDDEEVYSHLKARIVVTDDEIYVYVDDTTGQSKAVVGYSNRIVDYSGDAKDGWTVTTVDDETVTFRRTGGCACGSRLKSFDPFPGVPWTDADKRL